MGKKVDKLGLFTWVRDLIYAGDNPEARAKAKAKVDDYFAKRESVLANEYNIKERVKKAQKAVDEWKDNTYKAYVKEQSARIEKNKPTLEAKEEQTETPTLEGEGLRTLNRPISDEEFLKRARKKAKAEGYDPESLMLSDRKENKLMMKVPGTNRTVRFGATGYGDYIVWKALEADGKVPKGFANQKRKVFQQSHSQIKGNWKKNNYSPNMLALKILW
jgi:hypothetical protein